MLKSKVIRKEDKDNLAIRLKEKRRRKKALISSYKNISYPLKYMYPHDFYLFYCDVPLVTQEGTLKAEITLFNKFKIMKNAFIKQDGHKEVVVSLENNQYLHIPHWSYEIERIENSEGPDMEYWASKLKAFCQKYEETMREIEELSQNASLEQIKLLTEINKCTESKIAQLKEEHPYVHFHSKLMNHNFQCDTISFSEDLIKELGYNSETYISTILQEGIPQLTSFDDNVNLIPIKLVMENYLTLSQEGFESPVYETVVMMKSGYVKTAKNKVHVLINFDGKHIGIDVVSLLYDLKDPKLDHTLIPKNEYNHEFLDVMSKREKEMSNFLKKYYNETIPLRYTYHDKVCGIRELSVKNEEDLS